MLRKYPLTSFIVYSHKSAFIVGRKVSPPPSRTPRALHSPPVLVFWSFLYRYLLRLRVCYELLVISLVALLPIGRLALGRAVHDTATWALAQLGSEAIGPELCSTHRVP
jgi:hypothetical protein